MKKTKRKYVKYLVFIFVIIIAVYISTREDLISKTKDTRYTIVFISRAKLGSYWSSVKMGAELASKEFNVNMIFKALDDENDVDGQIKFISDAIEKKSECNSFSPCK